MTPQERSDKLAKIYKVIANKELSFWAIVPYGILIHHYEETIASSEKSLYFYTDKNRIEECDFELETIGHPVMIGDCLDWYEKEIVSEWCKYNFSCYFEKDILWKWKYKRTPIDYQSDECIDYIHSLIK